MQGVGFPFCVMQSTKNLMYNFLRVREYVVISRRQDMHMKEVTNEHFCPQGIYNLILDKIDSHVI